jgi:hypothetical protein
VGVLRGQCLEELRRFVLDGFRGHGMGMLRMSSHRCRDSLRPASDLFARRIAPSLVKTLSVEVHD